MPKRMLKVNCLAMGTATPPVLKNSVHSPICVCCSDLTRNGTIKKQKRNFLSKFLPYKVSNRYNFLR